VIKNTSRALEQLSQRCLHPTQQRAFRLSRGGSLHGTEQIHPVPKATAPSAAATPFAVTVPRSVHPKATAPSAAAATTTTTAATAANTAVATAAAAAAATTTITTTTTVAAAANTAAAATTTTLFAATV